MANSLIICSFWESVRSVFIIRPISLMPISRVITGEWCKKIRCWRIFSRTLATVKPSMPQFLKCMAPVDLSVNCTALDERLTVSADMEKEGVWLRNISESICTYPFHRGKSSNKWLQSVMLSPRQMICIKNLLFGITNIRIGKCRDIKFI